MSAQNSAGIQTLLDAEREASKIVQKGYSPNQASEGSPRRGQEGDRSLSQLQGGRIQEVRVRAYTGQQAGRGRGEQRGRGQDQGNQGCWKEEPG
ncbi:V-type ATPase [Colletotrichum kahawae]|uniref:V-type ATPase n=1 Tax=Colletotrichum kahawae TaxID=34407 RepID=A0AAD9Y1G2_COLKA|nr:V-type ATPase [Colletotrichum kahawae]